MMNVFLFCLSMTILSVLSLLSPSFSSPFFSSWVFSVAKAEEDGFQIEHLGGQQDWQLHRFFEGKILSCSLSSRPVLSSPANILRPKARFFITHYHSSPKKKEKEIAISAGATLKPYSRVILKIGTREYSLISGSKKGGYEAEWMWVKKSQQKNILKEMRQGYDMEVTAFLDNGEIMRDRYSLIGVSKGLAMAEGQCQ